METGNYVAKLNEFTQRTRCGLVQYEDLGSVGPDHDRTWVQYLYVVHSSVFVQLRACSSEMWRWYGSWWRWRFSVEIILQNKVSHQGDMEEAGISEQLRQPTTERRNISKKGTVGLNRGYTANCEDLSQPFTCIVKRDLYRWHICYSNKGAWEEHKLNKAIALLLHPSQNTGG